jgi:hypothetical protein
MAKKYIVVAGGVISGIGKGVIGQYHLHASVQKTMGLACLQISLEYRSVAQDGRSQGDRHQD